MWALFCLLNKGEIRVADQQRRKKDVNKDISLKRADKVCKKAEIRLSAKESQP